MDWEERAEVGDAVMNNNKMGNNIASEDMENENSEMGEDNGANGNGEVGGDDGMSGDDNVRSLYNIWWHFDGFDLMFCIFYLAYVYAFITRGVV